MLLKTKFPFYYRWLLCIVKSAVIWLQVNCACWVPNASGGLPHGLSFLSTKIWQLWVTLMIEMPQGIEDEKPFFFVFVCDCSMSESGCDVWRNCCGCEFVHGGGGGLQQLNRRWMCTKNTIIGIRIVNITITIFCLNLIRTFLTNWLLWDDQVWHALIFSIN